MTPVTYSPASQAIVDAFETLEEKQQSAAFWGSVAVDAVRGEIKDHYIVVQNNCCVYCSRRVLTNNKALWDAEHIISRAKAARFMFTPENLVVCCRDCNIAKGESEIRCNPARKSFPRGSDHYLIVHPHFDSYSEHIRWFGEVCVPISEKGKETLIVCDLTRFTTRFLGIQGIIVDPDFDQLVGKLLQAKTKVEALSTLAAIKVHAESIPQE